MIPCPSCGGALRFDIKTQKMACDLCDSFFELQEIDSTQGYSTNVGVNEYNAAVYICPSCGAELMTNDENDAVGFCPFCGGASMLFSQIRQQWKPDAVLPFRITKEKCKEAYLRAAKKSPFVSRQYRDPALIDSFRGIYMPYWIIDAEFDGDYGLKITTKENIKRSTYRINENHFVGHAKGVSRYVHDASLSFSDDISEELAPYPVKEIKSFSAGYLSGFYTEISDLSEAEYEEQIDEIITAKQAESLGKEPAVIGGFSEKTTVIKAEAEQRMEPQKTKTTRALLPIWFMSKRKKDRVIYAAVNGVTGKVAIDFPLSPIKILLTALITGGLLFLLSSYVLPTIMAVECVSFCCILMLIGLMIMESAYQKVLKFKLNIKKDEINKVVMLALLGGYFICFGGLLSVYIFLVFSHSSVIISSAYLPFLFFSVFGLGFLLFQMHNSILYGAELKNPKNLKLKAGVVLEINRYRVIRRIFYIIGFVLALTSIVIILINPPAAFYMYALCFLMTVNLFGAAIAHIRFQVALSMRRPPQMDKKGALYDEN